MAWFSKELSTHQFPLISIGPRIDHTSANQATSIQAQACENTRTTLSIWSKSNSQIFYYRFFR